MEAFWYLRTKDETIPFLCECIHEQSFLRSREISPYYDLLKLAIGPHHLVL